MNTCVKMTQEQAQEPRTVLDRLAVILLVISALLMGLHFHGSCAISCRASIGGSILAALAAISALKKKRSLVVLGVAAILGHALLVH